MVDDLSHTPPDLNPAELAALNRFGTNVLLALSLTADPSQPRSQPQPDLPSEEVDQINRFGETLTKILKAA